jgi:predicted negative regulator of RcsB-dependent stress response
MSRNTLYIVIAVLAAGVAVIGYQLYQERQAPSGVEIKIGEGGISIQEN